MGVTNNERLAGDPSDDRKDSEADQIPRGDGVAANKDGDPGDVKPGVDNKDLEPSPDAQQGGWSGGVHADDSGGKVK